MATNSTADVSNVKGVQGGYAFSAPYGTTGAWDDSSPFATLSSSFANMGYVSEDGIEEEIDTDTEEVTDMNGDVVFVAKSSEKETLTLTLISITKESLSEMHGHSNVTEGTSWLKVQHTSAEHDQRVYVFDLLLKGNRKMRKVVPNGQVTEVGSIVHGAGEVFAREITITCSPDSSGVRVYDYIADSTSTTTTTTTTGE